MSVPRVFVSARTSEGLELLRERIAAFASGRALNARPVPASPAIDEAAGVASDGDDAGRTGTYHSHA